VRRRVGGVASTLRRWGVDPPLMMSLAVLSLFGIAMIYSAGMVVRPSAYLATAWIRQGWWLGVGLLAFLLLMRMQPRWFQLAAVPVYVVSVLLLVVALVVGTGAGTQRWIQLGPLSFQPSEAAKMGLILALARYLSRRTEPPASLRDLLIPGALAGVPMILVLLQPDLGTTLVFAAILFAVLYWAGTPMTLLLLVISPLPALLLSVDTRIWSGYMVCLVLVVYLARNRLYLYESVLIVIANLAAGTIAGPIWYSLEEYQQNRLLVFLDPTVDPRGAGYNLIQSKVAVGSGGLTGKGFTEGTQKAFNFLPEQHTDFIFSVVGEELGFLGVGVALLAFGFLLYRMVRLAERAPNSFAGLVVFGIFGVWLVHIFLNVGMTVGVVPITGLPLPFISYGGTFLVVCWVFAAISTRLVHGR